MFWPLVVFGALILVVISIWHTYKQLEVVPRGKAWTKQFRKTNYFRFDADVTKDYFGNFDQPASVPAKVLEMEFLVKVTDLRRRHWGMITGQFVHKPASLLPPELCLLIVSKDPVQWLGVNKVWQAIANIYMVADSYEMLHKLGHYKCIDHLPPLFGNKEQRLRKLELLYCLAINKNYTLLRIVLKSYTAYLNRSVLYNDVRYGLWDYAIRRAYGNIAEFIDVKQLERILFDTSNVHLQPNIKPDGSTDGYNIMNDPVFIRSRGLTSL